MTEASARDDGKEKNKVSPSLANPLRVPRRQREPKKSNRYNKFPAHAFLYIPLPSLGEYCVKLSLSSFLEGVHMRKLVPAYRDDFLISYRVYMMTGSFNISLFEGTLHVDNREFKIEHYG